MAIPMLFERVPNTALAPQRLEVRRLLDGPLPVLPVRVAARGPRRFERLEVHLGRGALGPVHGLPVGEPRSGLVLEVVDEAERGVLSKF